MLPDEHSHGPGVTQQNEDMIAKLRTAFQGLWLKEPPRLSDNVSAKKGYTLIPPEYLYRCVRSELSAQFYDIIQVKNCTEEVGGGGGRQQIGGDGGRLLHLYDQQWEKRRFILNTLYSNSERTNNSSPKFSSMLSRKEVHSK